MLFFLLAAASCGLSAAASLLSPLSAWVMDASLGNYTPHGVDWFDPVASPINLALRDLKNDWYKVLGLPPTILSTIPSPPWDGDCIVVFALAPPGALPAEAFTIAFTPSQAGAPPPPQRGGRGCARPCVRHLPGFS